MRSCVIRAYEKTIAFEKGKNEYLRYYSFNEDYIADRNIYYATTIILTFFNINLIIIIVAENFN